jgi:hypothetical protein
MPTKDQGELAELALATVTVFIVQTYSENNFSKTTFLKYREQISAM